MSCSFLLLDPTCIDPITEVLIEVLFPFTNLGFLFLGLFTIPDVSKTMKHEYEFLKKELSTNEKWCN